MRAAAFLKIRSFLPPGGDGREEDEFRRKLQAAGLPDDVIEAILLIVRIGPSLKNPSAQAYARSMERSFDEYGLRGLSMQVVYFLMNAAQWTGPEAKANKLILKKWSNKPQD